MPDKSKWAGGPGTGGHTGGDWTQRYGNDFGCSVGEPVSAAFDCVILGQGWFPTLLDSASADGKKYGLQMMVANTGDNAGRVEAYYTHINQLAPGIAPGKKLSRGDPIGRVRSNTGVGIHLHFAMRAKTGTDFRGVDIPGTLMDWAKSTSDSHVLRFADDGKVVGDPPPPTKPTPPVSGELEGYDPDREWRTADAQAPYGNPAYSCLDSGTAGAPQVLAMQRAIGNRATMAALAAPPDRATAGVMARNARHDTGMATSPRG